MSELLIYVPMILIDSWMHSVSCTGTYSECPYWVRFWVECYQCIAIRYPMLELFCNCIPSSLSMGTLRGNHTGRSLLRMATWSTIHFDKALTHSSSVSSSWDEISLTNKSSTWVRSVMQVWAMKCLLEPRLLRMYVNVYISLWCVQFVCRRDYEN